MSLTLPRHCLLEATDRKRGGIPIIGLVGDDIYDDDTIRQNPSLPRGSVPSGLAAIGFIRTRMHHPFWCDSPGPEVKCNGLLPTNGGWTSTCSHGVRAPSVYTVQNAEFNSSIASV